MFVCAYRAIFIPLLYVQEKKQAAKEKLSQMEAELKVASQEMKAAKDEQDAQRDKSVRYVCLSTDVCDIDVTIIMLHIFSGIVLRKSSVPLHVHHIMYYFIFIFIL